MNKVIQQNKNQTAAMAAGGNTYVKMIEQFGSIKRLEYKLIKFGKIINQQQVNQELDKLHQVNRELERLCINEDIKYEHYKKIAIESVKHYKKLDGLKLKRQMEEQAIYQIFRIDINIFKKLSNIESTLRTYK